MALFEPRAHCQFLPSLLSSPPSFILCPFALAESAQDLRQHLGTFCCPPKCLSIFTIEIRFVTKFSVRTAVCPSDALSPLIQEGKFENTCKKAEQMSQNFGLSYINLLSRSSELSRCNQILWFWESWLFLWENSSFSMHTKFSAAQK